MKEKTELESKTTKLRMLKQSYLNQKHDLEELVQRKYPQQMKEYNEMIEQIKQDKQYLKENTHTNADNFSPMIIKEQIYNEKAIAGEKVLELCKEVTDSKGVYIGDYRGFKMYLEFNAFEQVFQVALKNKQTYRATLGNDKIGVITRLNNALDSMEKLLESNEKQLQNLEVQLKNAQETLAIPFSKEQELQEAMNRLKEVNKLLKIGEIKDKEVIDIDDNDVEEIEETVEQEQEKSHKKREYEYTR